jgi:hypothetical protein
MSGSARVTSIGVLRTTADAVQRFRGEASGALDDLDIELRRALEWIQYDRKEYWMQELRRSTEGLSQAKIQLQQAQVSRRVADHEPACVDEKRAIERAKRRLEIATQKIEAVKHWTRTIEAALDEFQRVRTKFRLWLDADFLKAAVVLNRMSETLQHYVALEVPVDAFAPILGDKPAAEETPPDETEKKPEAAS